MRVMVSGGFKTKSLVNELSSAFDVGTVEFTHENNLDNLKDLLSRGDYFDRALVMEPSWTYDEEDADDEVSLRNRLGEFSDFALSRLDSCEFVFIATTTERAKMISEETLLLSERLVVILKQPKYSLGTFKLWIKGSLPELIRMYGFNYEEQIKMEQSSRISESGSNGDFDWGETSGDVIDTAKEVEIFDKPEETYEDTSDDLVVPSDLESELDEDDGYASRFCGAPLEDEPGQFSWDKDEDLGWGTDDSGWGTDDLGGFDTESEGFDTEDKGFDTESEGFDTEDKGFDTEDFEGGEADFEEADPFADSSTDPFADNSLDSSTDSFEPGESNFWEDEPIGKGGVQFEGEDEPFEDENHSFDENSTFSANADELFKSEDEPLEYKVDLKKEPVANSLFEDKVEVADTSDLFSDDCMTGTLEKKEDTINKLMDSDTEHKIPEDVQKKKGIFRGIKGIGMKRRRDFTYAMNNNKGSSNEELRNLLNTFRGRGSTIVVTGTAESGKSVIAGNLGNLLNKMGYTVLIVDCDTIKRSQVYLNLDAYEAVHNIDAEMNGLKLAVNGLNTEIGRFAAIARQGLNILSAGLAADADDIENIIKLEKFTNFIYAARASYNFIIFDIDFRKLVGPINELVLSSDNIVITTKPNTKSMVELMIGMSNIDDMSVREAMFLRGDIVFSHVNDRVESIYGYKVNNLEILPSILDQIVIDLIGGPGDYSFGKMRVAGSIQYSSNFDRFWMNRNYASDTVDGEEIFMRLLSSIMLKH